MGCGTSRSPTRVGVIVEDEASLYQGKVYRNSQTNTFFSLLFQNFSRRLTTVAGWERVLATLRLPSAILLLLLPTPHYLSVDMLHSCLGKIPLQQRDKILSVLPRGVREIYTPGNKTAASTK